MSQKDSHIPKKIFISYQNQDRSFAIKLNKDLKDENFETWFDQQDIPSGIDWSTAVGEGLRTCSHMILVLTPESVKSKEVKAEWNYFLNENKIIYPLLLRDCEVPYRLGLIQRVDFRSDYGVGLKQIISYIKLQERQNNENVQNQNQAKRKPIDKLIVDAYKGIDHDVESWQDVILTTFNLLYLKSVTSAHSFILSLIAGADTQSVDFAKHLYLAALCLSKIDERDENLSNQIVSYILDILEDRSQVTDITIRIKLGEVLGLLGDTRIGKMIVIPAGKFIMGFDQFPNDRPVRVVMTKTYKIDAYPVTNYQFASFIEDDGYAKRDLWDPEGWEWINKTERNSPRYWNDPSFNKPNYPVVGVSWFEADAYARWTKKRLPTEVEWEKAARGIEGNYWPWGNLFNPDYLNSSDSLYYVNGTTPIGIYPAGQSPFGCFDMSGNISEWVSDWYKPYPNNRSEDTHYGEYFKVRRGGGWGWDQDFTRATCRNHSTCTADYAVIGFRCAESVEKE